jgi:transposase
VKAYSQDLRERIVKEVEQGETKENTAARFQVSLSTVKRYVRQWEKEGHLHPKPIPGRPPRVRAPLQEKLQAQLEAQPDATLSEQCEIWEAVSGVKVSISTMSRAIKWLKWTRKKKRWERVREKKKSVSNGEIKQKASIQTNSSFSTKWDQTSL